VIALDDIRVRGRRTLGLIRAALTTMWSRRSRRRTLRRLDVLLLLASKAAYAATLLTRELSGSRLASDGAVALTTGLLVCDDIVGCSAVCALAVGDLLVLLVCVRVLENDIPGVEKSWEETETAEREVDERVGATDALLDPNYMSC
jgi:hypothetical protein